MRLSREKGPGLLAFLENVLRWLQADPEDLQVVVTPERRMPFSIKNLALRFGLETPSIPLLLEPLWMVTEPQAVLEPAIGGITGDAGEGYVVYTPTEQGTHRIQVYYGEQTAKTVFAATGREPELLELQSKANWLSQLAQLAGGRFVEDGTYAPPLKDNSARREIPERTIILGAAPLWPLLFGPCGSRLDTASTRRWPLARG